MSDPWKSQPDSIVARKTAATPDVSFSVYRPTGRRFFYVQWRDAGGRQVTRSTRCTRKRSATLAGHRIVLDASRRTHNATWREFVDAFRAEHVAGLAAKSRSQYGTVIRHVARILDPVNLTDLDARAASRLAASLRSGGLSEESTRSYLVLFRAGLNWAAANGMLDTVPAVRLPVRSGGQRVMKGRPITREEFERMLDAVQVDAAGRRLAIDPAEYVRAWRWDLESLWLSGLRLAEAGGLRWYSQNRMSLELDGRRSRYWIPAEAQKSHRNAVCPIPPDFAEHLEHVPRGDRGRAVFRFMGSTGRRLSAASAGDRIREFGRLAGVVVRRFEHSDRIKYASAHDLRRAFGQRWFRRVRPHQLARMMRHANLDTTLRFYTSAESDDFADQLWTLHESRNRPAAWKICHDVD